MTVPARFWVSGWNIVPRLFRVPPVKVTFDSGNAAVPMFLPFMVSVPPVRFRLLVVRVALPVMMSPATVTAAEPEMLRESVALGRLLLEVPLLPMRTEYVPVVSTVTMPPVMFTMPTTDLVAVGTADTSDRDPRFRPPVPMIVTVEESPPRERVLVMVFAMDCPFELPEV